MIEDVLDCENWNGRSYWKLGVLDRLVLRCLPEAAEEARSKFTESDISADGRPDVGMGGSEPSGTTNLSCAMIEPSSTVSRSSRSRSLVRLLDRPDASEPARSLWSRNGEWPRLRLDSRESPWLLSRLKDGIRDLSERSDPMWGELELECRPKLKEGRSSSRHESSEERAGVDALPPT